MTASSTADEYWGPTGLDLGGANLSHTTLQPVFEEMGHEMPEDGEEHDGGGNQEHQHQQK